MVSLFLFPCIEIEKIQKDEEKEDEKFIDVVINKNMKLGQKVLIPVKQFPKVSTGNMKASQILFACRYSVTVFCDVCRYACVFVYVCVCVCVCLEFLNAKCDFVFVLL